MARQSGCKIVTNDVNLNKVARVINRSVDILVTSTHPTPTGKMIFGRLEDRPSAPPASPAHASRDTV